MFAGWHPVRMFNRGEYEPGSAAPIAGRYQLHHVLGQPTDVVCEVAAGQALAKGPRGWFWSLVQASKPGVQAGDKAL
jgi:hypothetical protein